MEYEKSLEVSLTNARLHDRNWPQNQWGTEGGISWVQPPPLNSYVLPKLSRIPSSVEYTSVTT
jgi:hypothetical protein